MKWIVAYIKWIMLVTGLLTASMIYYAISPQDSLAADFGHGLDDPLAILLVRNWGILVGLVGLMLIYGALIPPARRLVLSVAAVSKLAFVLLVLGAGSAYLAFRVRYAVIIDSVEVLLFAAYLLATRHPMRAPAQPANMP
ncbi:MAG TPA: hypothetical protein VKD28_03490 [Gemmatimonadales bacterium]|nr:hypothetical protein [Gemmatimonadales bacterium]